MSKNDLDSRARSSWLRHPRRLLAAAEDRPDPADPGASANARWKRAWARRLGSGSALALLLLALIAHFGPTRESVRRRFEFRPGAEGPLRVMPELSVEPGRDARFQEPESYRKLWRPPPEQQFAEPEPQGEPVSPPQPVPVKRPATDEQILADPDLHLADAVEMRLPQQTNPCFVLDRMVRPEYPLAADEAARRLPVVKVEVAFYVAETGEVTASYILNSTGGPVFDEVVLRAVNAWRFRPVAKPDCPPLGFWIRLPVSFRSPYETVRSPLPR